ncbi:hypothetical protein JL101_035425 (plasmid) [Skermanella rosea]|uniref:hypothetical protein n=1 Tax=Skermanella rosea TaxID=1817965 RepID=UPI00193373CC|nr:hypothetical protein [Skermanella rosea]UEM08090.1 hypothetical protein JL101_035425 [Skermanella rosea]
MQDDFTIIHNPSLRAAKVQGKRVTYGKATPKGYAFNPVFPSQAVPDPFDAALAWLKDARPTIPVPAPEVLALQE